MTTTPKPPAAADGAGDIWPFVESPGEFTERLRVAMQHFPLIGAVRNVLIENPPTLAASALDAQQGDSLPRQSEGVPVSPRGFGLACTVAWTELAQALRADGHTVADKSGPTVRKWIEDIVLDTFHTPPAAQVAAPASGVSDGEEWREGWALAYSGVAVYGDDGELQDCRVRPYIDWRRDLASEIRAKITERALAEFAALRTQDGAR